MKLYTLPYSKVLYGFYSSAIFVMANDKESAVDLVVEEFERIITLNKDESYSALPYEVTRFDSISFDLDIDNFYDDCDKQECLFRIEKFLVDIRAECEEKLICLDRPCIVSYSNG